MVELTKIAAVVIFYNPQHEFVDNLKSYAEHVSRIIIVDNSESPNPGIHLSTQTIKNVEIISNNENLGIAKAVNIGIEKAIGNGFDWVLLMDQDSSFSQPMITTYIKCLETLPEGRKVAVIGTDTGEMHDKVVQASYEETYAVITSGSLVDTRIFRSLGGYNEKLFIDEVDHEYCYRAKSKGFSILKARGIVMNHFLGTKKQIKTIAGKRKAKIFHSPARLYYIVRNGCYVINQFKTAFPQEMKARRKDILVRIKNNLLYGPSKFSALRNIIRGYLHFKQRKFGKLRNG